MHVGLPAQATLAAYHSRSTPKLDGSVVRVSPDALRDERTLLQYLFQPVEESFRKAFRED